MRCQKCGGPCYLRKNLSGPTTQVWECDWCFERYVLSDEDDDEQPEPEMYQKSTTARTRNAPG